MKKIYVIKIFFTKHKFFWLNENLFWYHEKKGDIMKIYFIGYKFVLIKWKYILISWKVIQWENVLLNTKLFWLNENILSYDMIFYFCNISATAENVYLFALFCFCLFISLFLCLFVFLIIWSILEWDIKL